jgi:two-component system phosphate regulon response regulator PhoB
MKLLIVEDDPWYAESLRNTLGGMTSQVASSSESAIEQVDEFKPDVILLDFQLGARNAMTLLNELQSYTDTRQIPVVILATDARRLKLENLAACGVRAILDKADATPSQIIKELKHAGQPTH